MIIGSGDKQIKEGNQAEEVEDCFHKPGRRTLQNWWVRPAREWVKASAGEGPSFLAGGVLNCAFARRHEEMWKVFQPEGEDWKDGQESIGSSSLKAVMSYRPQRRGHGPETETTVSPTKQQGYPDHLRDHDALQKWPCLARKHALKIILEVSTLHILEQVNGECVAAHIASVRIWASRFGSK